jgi:CHAT domain-containing protein
MLAYRLDLSIQPRHPADRPLVDELLELQAERNRLFRRWESREGLTVRGWSPPDNSEQDVQQDILSLEKRITDLWHKLLVHNADYARDAALWQVRSEEMQDYLPARTMLLEYFTAHDRLIAFLVTHDTVHARRIPWNSGQVQHLVKVLRRNFALVRRSAPKQIPDLAAHAREVLLQLHELLIAPVADELTPQSRLIIVAHGPLHYVPFQAVYNGESHLLERHEISYLPNGSLLRYLDHNGRAASGGPWAFGHSHNGQLPYARQEAHAVAAVLNGQVAVDDDVSLAHLRAAAGNCRILHLATHAMFHANNPLFSGLTLAGGEWLTTLDVFNLRLSASLVTLSACDTGQHIVGGGDELLGLMRAFLYAGAASLVLTQWAVEDQSTLRLMRSFYTELAAGQSKAAALRAAQLAFLHAKGPEDEVRAKAYTHPYFWAPFFLVGDTGPLSRMSS